MTPSFMSKRSDSTKRSHHASKFKMNRHALANEAFGYKEMIAPYLPSKSTLESSLHLARSHSLNKHSGDESMSWRSLDGQGLVEVARWSGVGGGR